MEEVDWAKLVSVLGGVLLFAAWLTQQFLYERWNSRLSQLNSAFGVYQTYQSNNALFNVLIKLLPETDHDYVRRLQLSNYENGLSELREAIRPSESSVVMAEVDRLTEQESGGPAPLGFTDVSEYARVQAALTVLQRHLLAEKAIIRSRKALSQSAFWSVYGLGTVLVIVGNILKP